MIIRIRALAGFLLVWGLTAPALAGVRADFDCDGVLDTATVVSDARPHIRITLSRTDGLVLLPLEEHVLSLVAADVDHDGLTDLAGITKRRGVVVWKNRGGLSFAKGHRALHVRRLGQTSLAPRHQGLFKEPFSPDWMDLATTTSDDPQRLAAPAADNSLNHVCFTATRVRLDRPFLPDAVFSRSAASRAPPVRSH